MRWLKYLLRSLALTDGGDVAISTDYRRFFE